MKGKYRSCSIKEMAKEGDGIKMKPTFIDDITTGLEQVKKMQSGELPKRSVKQMLQQN